MPFTVATKKSKTSTAVKTNVTVIHDSPSAEAGLAVQALIVKWQGTMRKDGVTIPENVTLKMSEWAPGTRHEGTADPVAAARTMTPEKRAALIATIKAMDAAK